jgi:hypothetical protein
MKTFNVLAFRLGSPTSVPVSSALLNFYQSVAQSVAGDECRFIDTLNLSTIPFDNNLILRRPYQMYPRFIGYIRAWKKWPEIVVVDLTNNAEQAIDRGGVLMNIAQAIQYTLTAPLGPAGSEPPIFILLLPVLPPDVDPIRQILHHYFASGKVVIISDEGAVFPESIKMGAPFPAQYRLSLANVREDPRIRAQVKLIRRLGHFRRSGSGTSKKCTRYAYDGSLCVPELAELLRQRIDEEELDQDTKPLLLYYSPPSHWLEDTVVAVAIEMGLEYYRVEEITSPEFPKGNLQSGGPALLIVPMVDSGQTLHEALQTLGSLSVPIEPKVLSILSTRSINEERREAVVKIADNKTVIEYALKVEQREYETASCPLCALSVPASNYESDEFTMLTTYDMWDMADGAGWKAEDDVPPYRTAIPLVPDYPSLIEKHGAWLMSKVRERLEELPGGFPADPLVICPAETGSLVFTDYLNLVLKVTVVRVPREVISVAQRGPNEIQEHAREWKLSLPQWYVQLSTISTEDIIVMDEFNVSGRTRASLTTLLRHFSIAPVSYFSLVDFDPGHSKQGEVPSFSLYDFQANQIVEFGLEAHK